MKKLFYIIIILVIAIHVNGQTNCNCQKMLKNGATLVQCPPLPVANDNTTQIGLGVGKIDNEVSYVHLTVRFLNKAVEIDKNNELSLWLDDGNVIDLQYYNSGLVYIGNSQVAQGIYLIKSEQISNIKSSRIKTVAFKLNDGLRRNYQVKMNSDILGLQLSCLK